MDPITILFLALAVFVIWRLRSVLGQRTGNERRPPFDPAAPREAPRPEADNSNVVTLPGTPRPSASSPNGRAAEHRWDGFAEAGSPLAKGFDAIAAADPSFDARGFASGARAAYEMIVTAFAQGDRKTLNGLLSREVFEGFDAAIKEREQRGEKVETTFVSIDKADVIDAQMKDRQAQVTVRFVSQLITATRNSQGEVVDGNPEKVSEVTDVWTFARDTRNRDPNWLLVATEAAQ